MYIVYHTIKSTKIAFLYQIKLHFLEEEYALPNKISAHCLITWILFFNYVTNHLETKGKKATICKDIAGRKPSVEFI